MAVRTRLGVAFIALFLAGSLGAQAQTPKTVARIGVVSSLTPDTPRAAELKRGLRERGYVEGQNLVIEWRPSLGRAERFPELAADLARLKVDVIVASDNPAIAAARQATSTIPIVMVTATDPVGTGFVASLARPGGNVTGLTFVATETQGKSLQVLKEAVPRARRVALLWNPGEPGREAPARELEQAAKALGIQVKLVGVRRAEELDNAFAAIAGEKLHAVVVHASQVTFSNRARIAALAARHQLPTIAWTGDMVEAGILMSYGASIPDLYRRAGHYVDRILKGSKPSELPVEQPTKFELVFNKRTAKQLGIVIDPALLARADHVIE